MLPNLLSLARLLLVPVVVWLLMAGQHALAFWLFVLAGISDAIDGFLARQLDARSELGGYLDPLADKALLVAVYITLGLQGVMESWLVILVVFRDLLIVGGVLLLQTLGHRPEMAPLPVSKANTAAQISFAVLLLAERAFEFSDHGFSVVFTFIVAATTLASGSAYLVKFGRQLLTPSPS
ncbi:MAG: CDP-alcohol phosphatidyltransferase family protein [Alphaproteobacteria bacterium]|nr:CDP-alcohol phosphatidyltransferase family protein [Alphaproteobacteria bacterium]